MEEDEESGKMVVDQYSKKLGIKILELATEGHPEERCLKLMGMLRKEKSTHEKPQFRYDTVSDSR